MIMYPAIYFEQTDSFPGLIVILPVLGTFLIIFSGESRQGIVYFVLSSRPMLFIGKRSYGLYLFHWPIYVIFSYVFIELTFYQLLVALILTGILTLASYKYIEQDLQSILITCRS